MSFTLIESTDYIADAIFALRDEQRQTTLALKSIASAIANKPCCYDPIAPEIIYDCATGEIKFIDWQGNITTTFPGLYFPTQTNCMTFNFGVGSGTNQPVSPDIPTWDETDEPWGAYNPDESGLYDDTLTPTPNNNKCEKINLFLYISIEKLDTVSDLFEVGTLTMATLVGILSGGLAPLAFVTIGGAVVEFAVTVSLIYGIAEVLMRAIPNWGDFTVGITEQFKQDALCALYKASTPTAVKKAWDNIIEANFDWFAPQAYLLRSFLSPSMANAIVDPNIVAREDQPRYLLSCSDCSSGTWTMQDCLWSNGSSFAAAKLAIFDSPYASNNANYRYTYQPDKTTPINGFILQGPPINAGRIRVISWSGTGPQPALFWYYNGWHTTYLPTDGSWHEIQNSYSVGTYAVGAMRTYGDLTPIGTLKFEMEGIPE